MGPRGDGRVRLVRGYAEVGGVRLFALSSAGPPPECPRPVVLVHGLGVSGRYLEPLARILAPHCRVFIPDLPGFGRSDRPAEVLSIPQLADALDAWVDVAVPGPAPAFLANSMGCQIVADLAARRPGRVDRAVFVGPTMDARGRSMLAQALRLLASAPYESPSLIPLVLRDYWECGIVRGLVTLRHALADRIEDKLPHVQAPVLIARGGHDRVTPQRWAEEMAALLPAGRVVTFPRAGHALHYSAPRVLARVILPFLAAAGSPLAA